MDLELEPNICPFCPSASLDQGAQPRGLKVFLEALKIANIFLKAEKFFKVLLTRGNSNICLAARWAGGRNGPTTPLHRWGGSVVCSPIQSPSWHQRCLEYV